MSLFALSSLNLHQPRVKQEEGAFDCRRVTEILYDKTIISKIPSFLEYSKKKGERKVLPYFLIFRAFDFIQMYFMKSF